MVDVRTISLQMPNPLLQMPSWSWTELLERSEKSAYGLAVAVPSQDILMFSKLAEIYAYVRDMGPVSIDTAGHYP
jgi:hypothetical protein